MVLWRRCGANGPDALTRRTLANQRSADFSEMAKYLRTWKAFAGDNRLLLIEKAAETV
ncbi:MAG: hypothetical protein NTU53_11600 [Planctomycetota bacterium]|nr:hypothetical protein [Planctomycetota bacterium]